jgi:hypothetical protein
MWRKVEYPLNKYVSIYRTKQDDWQISDGDLIKNQLDKNFKTDGGLQSVWKFAIIKIPHKLHQLSIGCWTYIIQSKDLDLPLLDKKKVYETTEWSNYRTSNSILLFGILFSWQRKYSK